MIWALWVAQAQVQPSVLDDAAFAFCHHPVAGDFDRTFCGLLDALPEDRCPGLRAHCAVPETPRGCAGAPSGLPGGLPVPPAPTPGPTPAPPPLPVLPVFGGCAGASSVLAWVLAMAVALGLVGVFGLVLRALGLRAPTPAAPTVALPDAEPEQAFADAVDDVPDLPSADLLVAARSALASGQAGEAAVLARGAVLRDLGERRMLRLHRARTDREYLGMADAGLRPDLGQVLQAAERHRWGQEPVSVGVAEGALAAATRLLALGLGLLLALPAWGVDRYGPAGDQGLARVLSEHQVRFRSEPLDALAVDAPVDLLVLDLSGIQPTDKGWEAIRAWVDAGGVLWVGGGPEGFPELGERVPVRGSPQVAAFFAEELVLPRWPDGPDRGFTDGEHWVRTDGSAPVAGAWVGEGYVLAMADPRLLWNGALVHPANEAFLRAVPQQLQNTGALTSGEVRVELVTIAAAERDPPPSRSLANLRLLPFALQVLALWLVLAAWRGWPFTRLREPPARDRHRFVEHLDAVARHYQARRATGHVFKAYATWALETQGRASLELAARRAGLPAEAARALLDRAETAATLDDPPNRSTDLNDMEELWKLTRTR